MADEERMSGALQENILTLLCFDDEHARMVRHAVTPQLFESSVYREIAGHAIDFIDQYGSAIKEHLPDHLEGILNGDDQRKASTYRRAIENLFLSRDEVNAAFVLSQLHKFVRLQKFKSGLIEAVEVLRERGDIDQAENIMEKAMQAQAVAFEPGIALDNPDDVGAIMDAPEEEGFTLGIPELDNRGIYPRRKELLGFIAARGRGKSWFATHCAKRALIQRWTPVIISLEMSGHSYAARMLQSFFSISRRDATVRVTRLAKDGDGALEEFVHEEVQRETMRDAGIREKLMKRAKREFSRRKPFRIKAFPSGTLTMAGLKAYLEGLRRHEKISPDVLIVDYPRLFDLDAKNLRLELGKVNVQLRGLATELNCAVVILAQGNRESESAFLVTGDMVEEDISLKATVDVLLTYSQTKAERVLGLARILADKVRNDESGLLVLITQAYAIGQFCLDSMRLVGDYWESLSEKMGRREGREERRSGRDRRRNEAEEGEDRPRRRREAEDEPRPRRRRED